MTSNGAAGDDKVADFYDTHTEVFSEIWGENLHVGYWHDENDDASLLDATDQLTDQLIERLAPRAGQRILDIGCGIGQPALRLTEKHDVDVVGISISQYQIDQANTRADQANLTGKARFQHADAMNLPFPDSSFDGGWALESMIHMPDKEKVLREVNRVLRPGSTFVIADMFSQQDENLTFQDIITAPKIDDYRVLIERAEFAVLDITDITKNTIPPRAVHERLRAALLARREDVIRVTGPEEFERMVDLSSTAPSYGYLLATLTKGGQA
jgi:ubiquinone/menaquinone biosynthesis C-methylase UbiE